MDWSSFYINILAGAIFFVLGILFSIWLIPKYTLKLIKKKNITYFNKKISFIIFELCEFLNGMPKEFKVNNGSTTFKVKNDKYPDIYDFVAKLNPDVLQPVAPEQLSLNIIKTVNYYKDHFQQKKIQSHTQAKSGKKKIILKKKRTK